MPIRKVVSAVAGKTRKVRQRTVLIVVAVALVASGIGAVVLSGAGEAGSRPQAEAVAPALVPQEVPQAPVEVAPVVDTTRPAVVVVQRGETLWGLAQQYDTTVGALQQANHLGHSTLIRTGQTLVLPPAGVPAPKTAHKAAKTPARKSSKTTVTKTAVTKTAATKTKTTKMAKSKTVKPAVASGTAKLAATVERVANALPRHLAREAHRLAAKIAAVKLPAVTKKHHIKKPVIKQPASKKHHSKKPVTKKPIMKKPVIKNPIVKKPIVRPVINKHDGRKYDGKKEDKKHEGATAHHGGHGHPHPVVAAHLIKKVPVR
ncbi:hypothetical protein Atai01_15470 [Amycolatopsis taiwanensis]|uniref:LysM domain-containing protein n=1 Tax=Amycolatopsis taiwanensis TaxID=342230 RepID=A0A9W6VBG0_9PSEU|nr:hypothetical protein Atai01_15470 [Amycolatopsis taiwanensis]